MIIRISATKIIRYFNITYFKSVKSYYSLINEFQAIEYLRVYRENNCYRNLFILRIILEEDFAVTRQSQNN